MFQPSSVHAWEALIQASAELNDAWSFLHILMAPGLLVALAASPVLLHYPHAWPQGEQPGWRAANTQGLRAAPWL